VLLILNFFYDSWVVGHSFIIYGPFLQGLSTVLYEGKPVMPGKVGATPFWRIIQEVGDSLR
jgi:propionyl-CoA synthetase